MADELETRDTVVIAVAQEEKTLDEELWKPFLSRFKPEPRFELLVDPLREKTTAYDRVSATLIDREGVVRQIFPMIIHARPSWKAILSEIDRMAPDGGGREREKAERAGAR